MSEKRKTTASSSKWLVIVTVIAAICAAGGIFYYYNFFRQDNARLIESVPDDAVFIFEVNDVEPFAKNITKLSPYMDEMFFMGSFAGFNSFLDKLPAKNGKNNGEIIISGHEIGEKVVLLHSAQMIPRNFDKLLKILQIDSRNCTEFENTKIYNYGTHYRKFYFAWHHNVFSASENIDLLKMALKQHKQVKNLTFDENFKKIFTIVEKNSKQNWLLVDYARYSDYLNKNINEPYVFVNENSGNRLWAAYQIRLTENEIKFAGYVQLKSQIFENEQFSGNIPYNVMPQNTDYCALFGGTPQICRFVASHDTVVYNYAAVPLDTTDYKFEKFIPENATPDSCVKFKGRSIFRAAENTANFSGPRLKTDFSNVLEQDGFALLGDTLPALKYYVSIMGKMATIEDNPLYRAVNQNLPSDFVYKEMHIFNSDYVRQRFFTDKTALSQTSQKISVFGISFSTLKDGVAPTNIYLRF